MAPGAIRGCSAPKRGSSTFLRRVDARQIPTQSEPRDVEITDDQLRTLTVPAEISVADRPVTVANTHLLANPAGVWSRSNPYARAEEGGAEPARRGGVHGPSRPVVRRG